MRIFSLSKAKEIPLEREMPFYTDLIGIVSHCTHAVVM